MRPQIPSLTGLRFVAAISVVLAHAFPKMANFSTPPKWTALIEGLAAEGMTLFFVLSGFVIYYNYSETIGRNGGIRAFFVARFSRLYPLYAVCVSYDFLVKFSFYQFPGENAAAIPYYALLAQSWIYHPIAGHALIYQFGLVPQVAWSISTEWFFYLAFPFIAVAIASLNSLRSRLAATLALVIAALAFITALNVNQATIQQYATEWFAPVMEVQQDSFYRWLVYFSPYIRIFEFILGCLCASIFMKLQSDPPSDRERRLGLWLTAGAITGMLVLHVVIFGMSSATLWHSLLSALHMNFGFAPFLAILIFCCARYQNAFVRLMSARMVILCGEASYSLYLVHLLVINAFRYEAAPITTWRIASGALAQLSVVIATSIGLSLVTRSLIEVPAQAWLRKLLTRRPAAQAIPPAEPRTAAE